MSYIDLELKVIGKLPVQVRAEKINQFFALHRDHKEKRKTVVTNIATGLKFYEFTNKKAAIAAMAEIMATIICFDWATINAQVPKQKDVKRKAAIQQMLAICKKYNDRAFFKNLGL